MHLSNTQILNSGKICKHKIVVTTSNTNKVLLHNTLLRKVNDKKKYKLQSLILSPIYRSLPLFPSLSLWIGWYVQNLFDYFCD